MKKKQLCPCVWGKCMYATVHVHGHICMHLNVCVCTCASFHVACFYIHVCTDAYLHVYAYNYNNV